MKKRYILNGFESREAAQNRNKEISEKSDQSSPNSPYLFQAHCLVKEQWGLEVYEDFLDLLEEHEKTNDRLKEIPPQTFANAYIPMLFRYLEEEYVDQFLNEGKLRLSSFIKFHNHKDEQRGDKEEGRNMVYGIGSEKQISAFVNHGRDAFVLSTSLILSENIQEEFNTDSGFIIENPIGFINAIIKEVPEFKGVNYGPCRYQQDHIIKRGLPNFDPDQLKDDDDPSKINLNKVFNTTNQAGGQDVLFVKTLNYSHQHEYRILWHSYQEKLPEHINIVSNEAASYCRKMEK